MNVGYGVKRVTSGSNTTYCESGNPCTNLLTFLSFSFLRAKYISQVRIKVTWLESALESVNLYRKCKGGKTHSMPY